MTIKDDIQQQANDRQRKAASPDANAWVSASAGTGKTKVLTDRILRLLLPRKIKGDVYIPGSPAHNILCLTFTKAAATEMKNRIQKRLAVWATIGSDELMDELTDLIGHRPDQNICRVARQLFARVIDAPGGMQIHTIHGFCQSVLRRFPIEANLPPQFEVMDESDANDVLTMARHIALSDSNLDKNDQLADALSILSEQINQDQFDGMLSALAEDREKIHRMLSNGIDTVKSALADQLGLDPDVTISDVVDEFYDQLLQESEHWKNVANIKIEEGTKTEREFGHDLANLIGEIKNDSSDLSADRLYDLFLSTSNTPYTPYADSTLARKNIKENYPDIAQSLWDLRDRVYALYQEIQSIQIRDLTGAVMDLADGILSQYRRIKQSRSKLDYDDLIHKTTDLFAMRGLTSWVLYKLDGGIDHILIDEAQDTNPLQWEIVSAIADEFYAGLGRLGEQQTPRTVFVVGDEKQSIFSFQKADPAEFARMKDFLGEKCLRVGNELKDVSLDVSFRSTRAVLQTVDQVFETPELASMVTGPAQDSQIHHRVFRRGMAGSVECWPLVDRPEKQTVSPWRLPTTIYQSPDPERKLASAIAGQIDDWLKQSTQLESAGRPIRPGDILILMRNRTGNLIDYLIRALKDLDIPTSGVDRMDLPDQIIVKDLMAVARFALLPSDDLTLAVVLKSPLIGMGEDDLYDLAIDRGDRGNRENRGADLWSALIKKADDKPIYDAACGYLRRILSNVDHIAPHGFFYDILNQPCPGDNISGRRALLSRLGRDGRDPLDEFMTQCLRYEAGHTPSLHGFLRWIDQAVGDIKREVDQQSADEVRIMTVHGAKGLEAPIVFMPDTTGNSGGGRPDNHKTLHWIERGAGKSAFPIFLWSPRSQFDTPLVKQRKKYAQQRERAEHARLLYVAMTRARDHLIIAGVQPPHERDGTWYTHLDSAVEQLGTPCDTPIGTGHRYATDQASDQTIDRAMDRDDVPPLAEHDLPDWINMSLPKPDRSIRPYRPTIGDNDDQPVDSPITADKSGDLAGDPYLRGTLIHDLLEYLPELPSDQWGNLIDRHLTRYDEFDEDECDQIRDEIISLLKDPSLAPFFAPQSVAEAGITGQITIDGQLRSLAGRIDRLAVIDDTVYILDYKTHRRPPSTMPTDYQRQLLGYKTAIRQVFPDHRIRSAVIWTAGPKIMWLDDDLDNASDNDSIDKSGDTSGPDQLDLGVLI